MPWVAFTGDYDWHPVPGDRRQHTAYKAGHVLNVTRACAAAAVAEGKARRIHAPSREAAEAIRANGNRRPA